MAKTKERFSQVRKATTKAIADSIRENPTSWHRTWSSVGSFCNGTTMTEYSGSNIAHCMFAALRYGFKDPRFCTMSQAKKLGFSLREDGYRKHTCEIEKWQLAKWYEKDENGEIKTDEYGNKIAHPYYRHVANYNLWNFEQFDNVPEYPRGTIDPDAVTELADSIMKSWICPIAENPLCDIPCYKPNENRIELPPRGAFDDSQEFIRNMLHEMAHSTLVPLKRSVPKDDDGRAFEELIAELATVFAASEIGLGEFDLDEAHYKNHAAYIGGWLKHLDDDEDYLFKACTAASAAARYISAAAKPLAKVA